MISIDYSPDCCSTLYVEYDSFISYGPVDKRTELYNNMLFIYDGFLIITHFTQRIE